MEQIIADKTKEPCESARAAFISVHLRKLAV